MFVALVDTGATIISNQLQGLLESPDYACSAEPCYNLKKRDGTRSPVTLIGKQCETQDNKFHRQRHHAAVEASEVTKLVFSRTTSGSDR